jgi:hypothetical protein
MKKEQKENLIAILIIAISVLIFFGICSKGETNIDDELIFNSLPEKPVLADAISIFKSRYNGSDYRPMVIFTFFLEQLTFGHIDLSISHWINVFIYFLIGIMIFFLAKSFPVEIKNKYYFSLFTALIFIIHPLHSSVVSSLKSRDNLLSMLFGTIGFLIFTYFFKEAKIKKYFWLPFGILSLFLATISKIDCISFFVMIPIYLFIFYPKKWKFIPFLGIIFLNCYILHNFIIEKFTISTFSSSVQFDENPLVQNYDFLNRLSSSAITILYYTKFLLIPKGYYYYFGYNQIPLLDFFHPLIFFSIFFHFSIFIFAIYSLKKHKIIGFSILFYLCSLAYCLNFFQPVAGIVADRYAFIATFGFALLWAYLITNILNLNKFLIQSSNRIKLKKENLPILLMILLMVFYFPFTYQRNKDWKNKLTLIEADLPFLQNSFHGLRIASAVYQEYSKISKNKFEQNDFILKSNEACLKAISVYDSNIVVYLRLATNLFYLKEDANAIKSIQSAIQITDTTAASYSLLANYYLDQNSSG